MPSLRLMHSVVLCGSFSSRFENTRSPFPSFVFSVTQNESGNPDCFVRPSVGASQQSRWQESKMRTLSELTVSPSLKGRLKACNCVTPTPVQAAAIPQALAGCDVIATAQTGTGKTLAFFIPVARSGRMARFPPRWSLVAFRKGSNSMPFAKAPSLSWRLLDGWRIISIVAW